MHPIAKLAIVALTISISLGIARAAGADVTTCTNPHGHTVTLDTAHGEPGPTWTCTTTGQPNPTGGYTNAFTPTPDAQALLDAEAIAQGFDPTVPDPIQGPVTGPTPITDDPIPTSPDTFLVPPAHRAFLDTNPPTSTFTEHAALHTATTR